MHVPNCLPLLADEARKWLGVERLRVMVVSAGADGKQQASREEGRWGMRSVCR